MPRTRLRTYVRRTVAAALVATATLATPAAATPTQPQPAAPAGRTSWNACPDTEFTGMCEEPSMTTTARNRMRLLVPAALAALAVSATTAAASVPSAAPAAHSGPAHDHRAPARNPKAMLDAWLRLWNGDFSQAPRIISPDFTVHAALLDGGDGSGIRGADGLTAWIAQTRAAFPDLRFSLQIDPLVAGHHASVRWTATGTYAGGFPGAKAHPGTVVTFTGTDTLRIKDGKFVEYWLNSDTLQLLTQLHAL